MAGRSRDVQEDDTPEDDDVKVEDVCYAQREAEDYAEYAGPGGGVLALAHSCRLSSCCLRVPLSVYTYNSRISSCLR
jgi:hypothetical protein